MGPKRKTLHGPFCVALKGFLLLKALMQDICLPVVVGVELQVLSLIVLTPEVRHWIICYML